MATRKNVTAELMAALRDRAAELGKNPTNYAAANLLGVSHSRMANWSVGRSGMSDEIIARACEILWPGDAEMLGYWLARRHAETAPEDQRDAWRHVLVALVHQGKLAGKLGRKAAVLSLLAGAVAVSGVAPEVRAEGAQTKYYVKSRRRRNGPQSAPRKPGAGSHHAKQPADYHATFTRG